MNNLCPWAVCYDIDSKHYDDRKRRAGITAVFRDPHLADEFIEKCLPEETRSRFYVKHIDRMEA